MLMITSRGASTSREYFEMRVEGPNFGAGSGGWVEEEERERGSDEEEEEVDELDLEDGKVSRGKKRFGLLKQVIAELTELTRSVSPSIHLA
jgi:hypothetical protein